MARFASSGFSLLLCSSSCPAEGDKLIGGFGLGFWALEATGTGASTSQSVPFLLPGARRTGRGGPRPAAGWGCGREMGMARVPVSQARRVASAGGTPRRVPKLPPGRWAIGHSHLLLLRLRDPAPVALSGRRPCHGGARPHAASPPPRRSATLRRSPASSPGPARRLPRCLRSRLLSKPSREPSPSPPPPPHPPPRPHHAAPAQPPQLPPGRGPRYCRAALPSRARHLGSLCARVIWVVSASSLLWAASGTWGWKWFQVAYFRPRLLCIHVCSNRITCFCWPVRVGKVDFWYKWELLQCDLLFWKLVSSTNW
jgi:hypothetical protein